MVPWLKLQRRLKRSDQTRGQLFKFVSYIVVLLDTQSSGVSVERSFRNVRHIHSTQRRSMTRNNLLMNVSVYTNQRSLNKSEKGGVCSAFV